MSRYGNISGKQAVVAFAKDAWVFDRQRGSHVILKKAGPYKRLAIPLHKELGTGLLHALIRDAGLTVDEFLALL